jgi:hypothetical protein
MTDSAASADDNDNDAAYDHVRQQLCHGINAQVPLRFLAATCGSMLVATASAVTLIPELACFSFGEKPQRWLFEIACSTRSLHPTVPVGC